MSLLMVGAMIAKADDEIEEVTPDDGTSVYLDYEVVGYPSTLNPVKRTAHEGCVVIVCTGIIYFPQFSVGCTLEIENATTGEIELSEYIEIQRGYCYIPTDLVGNHTIRFIFGSYMYCGHYVF